jgi:hypothetical protein
MAAHPKRQLGSASGSILWLNTLSRLSPEWSLCRHIATCLLACWCHLMVPNRNLICMQLFLQVYWLRRRLVAQLALIIETIYLGAVIDSVSVLGVAFYCCQSVHPFIFFYTSVTRDSCQSGSSAA